MDQQAMADAVEASAQLLRADGADLVLVGADPAAARISLRVVMEAAGCQDCVLPPAELHTVISAGLARRLGGEIEVSIDDPRTLSAPAPWRIRVPLAQTHRSGGAPAHTLDRSLAGVRVGLRHEGSWRSWMLIVAEWERFLRRDGALPEVLQTGERVGDQGGETFAGVDAWVAEVDCGISGLGTCGSCTSWSVRDAVTLEAAGKPAVVAVTEEFAGHAGNMATHLGHPNLKLLVFPHPLEARPADELRQMAVDRYPDFLAILGVRR